LYTQPEARLRHRGVRHPLARTAGARVFATLRVWARIFSEQTAGRDDGLALPEHLSTLVGALHGPADLGRNHDKYLTYPDRDDAARAASA